MSNWTQLKAAIASVVKLNGNNEITGQLLQDTLFAMVSDLGANATLKGLATPSTAPSAEDGSVFYVATTAGSYTNFGLVIAYNGIYVLLNPSGSWQLIPLLVLNKLVANIFALNTGLAVPATLLKGEFAWNKRKWYTKYIFTMVSDGWHFLKFLNIMAYITAIVIQTTNDIRLIITILVCVFVAYTIVGLSFEYGYKFLWRK
jgi:hypothetical protein